MNLDLTDYLPFVLFSGPLVALVLLVPFWGASVSLAGLVREAEPNRNAIRFELVDFFALITLMSFSNSVVSMTKAEIPPNYFWVVLVGVNLLGLLLWVRCLKFNAAQEIRGVTARLFNQLVIFPGDVVGISTLLVAMLMIFFGGIGDLEFRPGVSSS